MIRNSQVLGALAEAYGEIVPVPAERICFEENIGRTGVRTFLTLGHAQHHCSYLLDDLLFGGEVTGVRCTVPDGIFTRPATSGCCLRISRRARAIFSATPCAEWRSMWTVCRLRRGSCWWRGSIIFE